MLIFDSNYSLLLSISMKIFLPIICLILIATFSSCNQNSPSNNFSLKDSILKEHLSISSSNDYYDTTNIDFKILKAYYSNDTNYLKKIREEINEKKKRKGYRALRDRCIQEQPLKEIDSDESYRFSYSFAFCDTNYSITISKKASTIQLHFIMYKTKWDIMDTDTTKYQVFKRFDRSLNDKDWVEFKDKLGDADFWALKEENGVQGFDVQMFTLKVL